jgi:ArsR family transcriptional regulator, lead/cadmium/zinc/bismuth-responsive transcriptional repressor
MQRVSTRALCNVPCFKGNLVSRLRKRMPNHERLKPVRAVFAALADQQRLKILLALQTGGELCVCDVAHVLGVSVSVASHHLRKLRDLGILDDRNDGRMAYYSVRKTYVADLVTTVLASVA